VSESATALGAPGRDGLALGFTSYSRWFGWLELAHTRSGIDSLVAVSACEGRELAPGASFASERLFLAPVTRVEDALGVWAERAGRELAAPVPARSLSGWCSWYRFGTKVTVEDVRRNLHALRELGAPLDVVQIDDGFQAMVGDWLSPAPGFPEGLAPIAREIRAEGLRAGLWLAPFVASRSSRLAREKPEWLVRDSRGRPLVALWNPAWKGRTCYALDATHPGVEAWLEALGREVRALGFDYLKLDFLFAGALPGARHDPSLTPLQAYRRGVAALRRGAGAGVFLLGCGAPLGASVGLFEAMRIGPDIAARWHRPALDRGLRVEASPGARNALANVLARAPLHQRLWLNDPDCVLLRPQGRRTLGQPFAGSRLTEAEVRTLVAVIALSGGLPLVSDELAELPAERLAWLRRMLPSLDRVPEVGPARGPVPEELVTHFDDGSALFLRVNLGDEPAPVSLDLPALGFARPTRVWDVLESHELALATGKLHLGSLEPHACVLLRLVPDDGSARVVGSSLHLAAGALETEAVLLDGPGTARIRLKLRGRREGEVAVAIPGAPHLVRARVAFHDALELTLHASRTEGL
jgi:alpha-galactosidase